ncbi:hypothetical protein SAMN05421863_101641 [Nitrosomonas communis]|uniref:Uncharacterized protein n=1 Tax=Nitrosomonas communis TaxID=44574 RepID=A0A1I4NSX8_9PROT|nr:hypothetical protein SAMN05421863_101641 [Nitrosomonas communis]
MQTVEPWDKLASKGEAEAQRHAKTEKGNCSSMQF